MRSDIINVSIVINIVHIYFELVVLFEVVDHLYFGNPGWIEIVVDDFGLPDLRPLVTVLLVHEEDRV